MYTARLVQDKYEVFRKGDLDEIIEIWKVEIKNTIYKKKKNNFNFQKSGWYIVTLKFERSFEE